MSGPLLLRCTALTCYTPMILGFGVSAMIKRREFIMLVGGAATLPLAARAQQPAKKMLRVGTVAGTQKSSRVFPIDGLDRLGRFPAAHG